ncbi:MAG: MauE/DoxX family redox-associated membrane protein [Acidimicrobiia bacterium]
MLAVAAAVVLGALMCAAGGAKVVMGARWSVDARAMGAPAWVAPIVPWFEIALGASLVAQLWRPVMAVVALTTLQVFTLLIVAQLSRGHRPVCACFGAWSARPLGASHVVRNVAMMLLAVLALIAG